MQATGCGADGAQVNNERDICPLGPRGSRRSNGRRSGPLDVRRPNPTAVSTALARCGPPRCGGRPSGSSEGAGQEPAYLRGHRATESVRGSHVRPGFLSRWAQEVGGRRKIPRVIFRAAPGCSGLKLPRLKAVTSKVGLGSANCTTHPRKPTERR